MYRQIIFSVLGGLSGGILYFAGKDVFSIYISKTKQYTSHFTGIKQLINPGFILGSGIGFFYGYTGKPLLKY